MSLTLSSDMDEEQTVCMSSNVKNISLQLHKKVETMTSLLP